MTPTDPSGTQAARRQRTGDLMGPRLFRRFEGRAATLQGQLRDLPALRLAWVELLHNMNQPRAASIFALRLRHCARKGLPEFQPTLRRTAAPAINAQVTNNSVAGSGTAPTLVKLVKPPRPCAAPVGW